ncbi:MAG: chromosomal replication initiator protein DnaA [Ruminococcaceae bacterium]|nr:chromosomal replication initiator protein DnaA [Oscillospiraceae bacterium]
MESFEEIWQLVKQELKKQVTEVAYNVWLSPLEFVKFENNTVFLSISEFKKNIIADKFMQPINNAFENILGFSVQVVFVIPGDVKTKTENTDDGVSQSFEHDYTFDNFITGPSNRFAHAAALNVANNPGLTYNPLFIYGHSGLGKTHLLLAIMNEIKQKNPKAEIIYTSGELFTNEFIYYIGNHNTYAFHEKYRKCDVLLVDDIQFIAKTETTQEEFFHTFNALKNNGSQIVLTSDRPPREMMTLEERLRTRFEMGLIADVQPPTLETRMAIVKKKSDDLNIILSDDVIKFIAENIKKNIRQLEGIVKKISAYRDVEGASPSIAVAKRAISDIINDSQPLPVTVENIINEVARTFDVSATDIRSSKKNANISLARQVAIYIVDRITGLSLKAIGNEFGNKHHSTIIYSLKECKAKIEKDVALKATIDDIIKNINEQ